MSSCKRKQIKTPDYCPPFRLKVSGIISLFPSIFTVKFPIGKSTEYTMNSIGTIIQTRQMLTSGQKGPRSSRKKTVRTRRVAQAPLSLPTASTSYPLLEFIKMSTGNVTPTQPASPRRIH